MRVKFCGMTNIEDVKDAVDLGVDFVGFVFYEKSRRFVNYDEVKKIIGEVRGDVKTVGVFVNQSDKEIKQALMYCSLDYAQVYHNITGINTISAYRIDKLLPKNISDGFILFDSYTKSIGGSGVSFDLDLIKNVNYKNRLFIAGGVSAANIEKIKNTGVLGVDLVSSIEAYPGKKDVKKMEDFMKTFRGFENE